MKYLKTYEARKKFSEKYSYGDLVILNHNIKVYEDGLKKLGYDDIKGIPPFHFDEYAIARIIFYDPLISSYLTRDIFSGSQMNSNSSIIIRKLEDDEFDKKMVEKIVKLIDEHVEIFKIKKDAEKYNL